MAEDAPTTLEGHLHRIRHSTQSLRINLGAVPPKNGDRVSLRVVYLGEALDAALAEIVKLRQEVDGLAK